MTVYTNLFTPSALLALLVFAAIPYGSAEPWWDAIVQCLIFLVFAFSIFHGLLVGEWRTAGGRLIVPLLALVTFAFIQSMWLQATRSGDVFSINGSPALSADPFETRLVAFKFLSFVAALELFLRYTSSTRRLKILIYTILGIAVASAVFGIARQTTQRSWQGFVLPLLEQGSGYGQFINRNHFAFLMEMGIGLVLGLLAAGGVKREQLLTHGAIAVLLGTAVVLSYSRGGIFSMVAQVIFAMLLWSVLPSGNRSRSDRSKDSSRVLRIARSWIGRSALLICMLTALVVGIVWVGGDNLVGRIQSVQEEIGPNEADPWEGESRPEIWYATLQMIKEHPVAGVGFGGYWALIPKYHEASGASTPQQAHNDYLELLASGGIIGLGLALWFFVEVIRSVLAKLKHSEPFRRAACIGAVVGLFGVAIHSLLDFGLHLTSNALIGIALLAIATTDIKLRKRTQPSATRT